MDDGQAVGEPGELPAKAIHRAGVRPQHRHEVVDPLARTTQQNCIISRQLDQLNEMVATPDPDLSQAALDELPDDDDLVLRRKWTEALRLAVQKGNAAWIMKLGRDAEKQGNKVEQQVRVA